MGVLFGTIGGRMTVGLKTSKRICGNLQFLSMSLTSERILVYSEAALWHFRITLSCAVSEMLAYSHLFGALAYRVIIAIFLNSIYMCLCTVLACFFLTSFTQYNRLPFHPPLSNWFKRILCNGWVTFHCVYVHQLSYPLVSWWTSRLLPCPGYY